MKKALVVLVTLVALCFQHACKEEDPEPGTKLSGRLLVDCDNPTALPGKQLELWEDARPISGTDSTPEKFITSTTTDGGGYFVFNYKFDSVPMSVRLADEGGGTLYLARGIFGWHNYINTFNSIVADVLQKGNKAKFIFNLQMPGGWTTGDSVVYRIDAPNKAGGYRHVFKFGENLNDTVSDIRAFTRVMDNQSRVTPLDRRFSFPIKADFYLSGLKMSKEYWIPTITCKGDSLHVFRFQP